MSTLNDSNNYTCVSYCLSGVRVLVKQPDNVSFALVGTQKKSSAVLVLKVRLMLRHLTVVCAGAWDIRLQSPHRSLGPMCSASFFKGPQTI